MKQTCSCTLMHLRSPHHDMAAASDPVPICFLSSSAGLSCNVWLDPVSTRLHICAERLRRELNDSQQDNASLVSSLRCKVKLLVVRCVSQCYSGMQAARA